MEIICLSCGNKNRNFIIPVWSKTTFQIIENGDLKILHLTPLESIEDKVVDRKDISCKECGSDDIEITINPHENMEQSNKELKALEELR